MCGIFGIVKEKEENLGSILIGAAEHLTYRGYDSVGMTTINKGEWSSEYLTFGSKRAIKLDSVSREHESLYLVYKIEDLGYWEFEITPERVVIKRI